VDDLSRRVALVTGAGQGVGAAIARALAARGAAVAVNDLAVDRADGVTESIREAGGQAVTVAADITEPDEVEDMVRSVAARVGPVDVLVNNAGLPPSGIRATPFVETTRPDWDRFISLNLYGVLHCSRLVLEHMVDQRWGRVISIVSDAGRVGEPGMAAYSAAKAGAMGFSRALAKEVGPHGVTCNCVSLGSIAPAGQEPDAAARRAIARYPMRRLGTPEDVAGAVLWLASPAGDWVTGQTVAVNGGYVPS